MAIDKDDTPRSRRFNSEKSTKDFAKAVKGTINDLRSQPQSKSNFKVNYTKGNANKRNDSYIDQDDDDDENDVTYCDSDHYESNCNGSDVPDHIDFDTAHFDEDGNYVGGTMIDQSEN